MKNKTYASVLLKDFKEKKNLLTVNKFRKGPNNYKLWLFIFDNYFNKINTTLESIIAYLSKSASRKTISVMLNDLEKEKLINRKKSISDNRVLLIEPSQLTVQEFNEWIQEFKSELNKI